MNVCQRSNERQFHEERRQQFYEEREQDDHARAMEDRGRAIFHLRTVEGLTFTEIGERYGISGSLVRLIICKYVRATTGRFPGRAELVRMSEAAAAIRVRTLGRSRRPRTFVDPMPPNRSKPPRSPELAALGRAIGLVMAETRMTLEAVADGAGLDPQQVSRYARGQGNPTLTSLRKLCKGLRISSGELMRLVDEDLDWQSEGL